MPNVAAILNPEDVTDPAVLRRMVYRLFVDNPSRDRSTETFKQYVARHEVEVPPGVVDRLFER